MNTPPVQPSMSLAYQDFAPRATGSGGFLGLQSNYEPMDQVLAQANAWITQNRITVINIETVLLPIRHYQPQKPVFVSSGETSTTWLQIIRVWYDANAPR